VLCAFDLIELDGEDLRRTPIEQRKDSLLRLVQDHHPSIVFNAHYVCRWQHRVQKRLCARLRGHRVETARLTLSIGTLAALAQDQEPGRASGQARGGRTGAMSDGGAGVSLTAKAFDNVDL